MSDPIRAALEQFIALADEDMLCPGNPAETDWDAVAYAIAEGRAVLAADGPAVPESREPASVADHPSDKELNALWNCSGIADEHGNHTGNIFEFARTVLTRWGHQPTPPAEGEVPAVLESREPASVADHPGDEWDALVERAWDKYQTVGYQGERFMYCSDFDSAMDLVRKEFARWGNQPTPPAEGEVGEFIVQLKSYAEYGIPIRLIPFVVDRAATLLQQQESEINRLRAQQTPGERELAAVEALQRLRRWGRLSGGGYSADVVLGVVDWIDGGMVGELPPLPAHVLPMPQGEVG